MDHIWQWAWDRYATRYSWAIYAVCLPVLLPTYLLSTLGIVAFEGLLTQQTVDPLVSRPTTLTDRGSHELKRKSAAIQVFALARAI
jgi:hypothetical protein